MGVVPCELVMYVYMYPERYMFMGRMLSVYIY